MIALAGWWPGAVVAHHHYRHTTIKQPFRTVFWLSVVASCAALAGLVVVESLSLLRPPGPPTMP